MARQVGVGAQAHTGNAFSLAHARRAARRPAFRTGPAAGLCARCRPEPGSVEADWPGGFFCPCHGSKFDLAGRVYKNVPAPSNLDVPPHRYVDASTLLIGEGPEA
jgi:Rieske Fe-S protein